MAPRRIGLGEKLMRATMPSVEAHTIYVHFARLDQKNGTRIFFERADIREYDEFFITLSSILLCLWVSRRLGHITLSARLCTGQYNGPRILEHIAVIQCLFNIVNLF